MRDSVVLLHGFAATRRSWDPVSGALEAEPYRPLALDLRGHGGARDARPVSFAACVGDVLAAAPPGPMVLAGYSMGGRIALHVALAARKRVSRLVVVAATAGIADDDERAARRACDEQLARFCEQASIEQFADRWAAQPLFAGDAPEVGAAARADTLRNDPGALAASLRGVGTGVQEPLWERLRELTMPVTLVAGERDAKFVALNERMAALLPRGELVVVPGAGHRLLLEAPGAVAAAVAGTS